MLELSPKILACVYVKWPDFLQVCDIIPSVDQVRIRSLSGSEIGEWLQKQSNMSY